MTKLSLSQIFSPAAPFSAKCGSGWEERSGSDYCYIFSDVLTSWFNALSQCKAAGGSLASISSRDEQLYLQGEELFFIKNSAFIARLSAYTGIYAHLCSSTVGHLTL